MIRVKVPRAPAAVDRRRNINARFSEGEKLSAVRRLERGENWREVAHRFDVTTGTLSRWREQYGDKKAKPTTHTKVHSTSLKLRAVTHLKRGDSLETVARRFKVHTETLRKWRRGLQLGDPSEQNFSRKFKLRAVAMLKAGWPITELAEKLRVSDQSLRTWRTVYGRYVRAEAEA